MAFYMDEMTEKPLWESQWRQMIGGYHAQLASPLKVGTHITFTFTNTDTRTQSLSLSLSLCKKEKITVSSKTLKKSKIETLSSNPQTKP